MSNDQRQQDGRLLYEAGSGVRRPSDGNLAGKVGKLVSGSRKVESKGVGGSSMAGRLLVWITGQEYRETGRGDTGDDNDSPGR